jgi:hypothetical protein
MPQWSPGYVIRRSNHIVSFGIRQNYSALNIMGESCFLLKRFSRATSTFQLDNRIIPTMTQTASAYTVDPDTGFLRYKLWGRSTHSATEYPDIGVITTTVQSSGSTDVWTAAADKYSFIPNRTEWAADIFQDEYMSDGTPVEDAVYIVFNTPPMMATNTTIFTYGTINPLVNFSSLQPVRDNEPNFQYSLFGFEQWLNPSSRIRGRVQPNRFLLAFPGILSDFTVKDDGLIQETKGSFWTTPPPYSPLIEEHDVIVRESTGERFQVTNFTPIMIENILVSQHLDLCNYDPRSSIYNIVIQTD